ncbi:MAG TPA: FKBP-type peptidyl-prolyl cis-trans isomerase [Flavitalea sp.]|nr:FKBP-type peptidyl-prolyl cis-trans isomerase [Flavitalea sp.]
MLKIALSLFSLALVLTGCLKKEMKCPYVNTRNVAPVSEQEAVLQYLTDKNINDAIKHSSGMYYKIVNPGTGTDSVGLCSEIAISYTGRRTDGFIFDQQSQAIFVLGSLIDGWKQGIPLIRKGGQIRLFIPPSLGYGSKDIRNNDDEIIIPAESILDFDIILANFSTY